MTRLVLVAFVIDGHRYAVALGAVERVLPMVAVSPLPEAPAIALGVINVHGTIVPVVDVRRRFGLPARDFGVTTRLLLAHAGRRTLAVPADEVLGVVEVADLRRALRGDRAVVGCESSARPAPLDGRCGQADPAHVARGWDHRRVGSIPQFLCLMSQWLSPGDEAQ